MRDILFRGFYEDEKGNEKIFLNGEWVKGKWVFGGTWKNARGQRFITEESGCVGFSVIPETVGEYIGRQDKDDTKIFEGDVVHSWGGEYCQGYWEHNNTFEISSLLNPFDIIGLIESENIEIIGNIYM